MKRYRDWLYSALLIGAIFVIYQPAWNGQPLLDDGDHLIRGSEASLRGLLELWTTPPSRQYHPLVDTVFWVGKHLWGGSMLGYHLVTISLHAAAALLLVWILLRLRIPGAWLAGAIFAVHPVQVESVAWVVELKNTMSAVLYFICILAYLEYEEKPGKTRWYVLLLLAFAAGMLAKPILATVPVAILIVQWWREGTLEWRKHLSLWMPLILLGIAGALIAVWMEREFSGAEREIILLSPIQRFLVAGRAFCFYLGKIIWPSDLSFMYPHWKINPSDWWQYLFPVAAIFLFALAWMLRLKWRGLLAGLLFFFITIFPLLGFFNVSFFRFSFVADHFQYLPIIGIVAPLVAAFVVWLNKLGRWQQAVGYGCCGVLLLVLAGLSRAHAHDFTDQVACYRAVVKHDPTSWAGHLNLAFDALARNSSEEAREHFETVLETNAENPPAAKRAHLALSAMSIEAGRTEEAKEHLEKALELDPNYAEAHANLGGILLTSGHTQEGFGELQRALQLSPHSAAIQLALAWQLATCFDPSLRNGREALRLAQEAERSLGEPNVRVLRALAAAHAEVGEFKEAGQLARRALEGASRLGDQGLARRIENDIQLYDLGRPNHNGLQ